MRSEILDHLEFLYGVEAAPSLSHRLEGILGGQSFPGEMRGERPLTQRDAMLITYGDQFRDEGETPLRTLAGISLRWWRDLVSAIHILPFYPYTSDDGFSVKDYSAVDPALGDWGDVRALAADFELMFDAVFNHMSAQSDWFSRFLAGDPEFADFFVTVEGDPDLSAVVRPRALPLLVQFKSVRGLVKVWTTFSADQVDLNFRNPEVLLRLVEVLLFYVRSGASWIRLDAIAFLFKIPGTNCIHLPETHRFIQLLRAILDEVAPWVRLVTETNVPHVDNISYFGDGTNEAQLVYNFALPPLVLHTLQTGDATALTAWAATLSLPSDRVTFFNFLASHDGIGLNPARGLLSAGEIEDLVGKAAAHGGYVSFKSNPDGSRSPYELNVNYFDALSDPHGNEAMERQVARFLCAHSLLLSWQGVPGIYVHSLLGSRGDREAAEVSGIPRRINRAKLQRAQVEAELAEPGALRKQVYDGLGRMLRVRQQQAAFNPASPQQVSAPQPQIVVVRRGGRGVAAEVWCVHNIGAEAVLFDSSVLEAESRPMRDLLGSAPSRVEGETRLSPYQVLWLMAKPA